MDRKIASHYEIVKKHHPNYLKAVEKLGDAAKNAGPLDEKMAQLIQLGASVTLKSEGATHSHTKRAIEAGATHEEIRHTVLLLTNTIGFPNVMAGMSWVNDILEKES